MKFYTLEAVVKGKNVKFEKVFASRDSAIDYMFNFYKKNYMYDMVVNDEHSINDNKHNVEYICDHADRFTINRVTL